MNDPQLQHCLEQMYASFEKARLEIQKRPESFDELSANRDLRAVEKQIVDKYSQGRLSI